MAHEIKEDGKVVAEIAETEGELIWTRVKQASTQALKQMESETIVQKGILELAESKIKESLEQ